MPNPVNQGAAFQSVTCRLGHLRDFGDSRPVLRRQDSGGVPVIDYGTGFIPLPHRHGAVCLFSTWNCFAAGPVGELVAQEPCSCGRERQPDPAGTPARGCMEGMKYRSPARPDCNLPFSTDPLCGSSLCPPFPSHWHNLDTTLDRGPLPSDHRAYAAPCLRAAELELTVPGLIGLLGRRRWPWTWR
jgi:hypothetical protein